MPIFNLQTQKGCSDLIDYIDEPQAIEFADRRLRERIKTPRKTA